MNNKKDSHMDNAGIIRKIDDIPESKGELIMVYDINKKWQEGKVKINIAAACRHTVGLKSDGTVVAVGDNKYGQCDISGWRDIQLPL